MRAQEDWLKNPIRESPLWPKFEQFLETQADACRERERLGLVTVQSDTRILEQITKQNDERLRQNFHIQGGDRGIQKQRHHQQMTGDLQLTANAMIHIQMGATLSHTQSQDRGFFKPLLVEARISKPKQQDQTLK